MTGVSVQSLWSQQQAECMLLCRSFVSIWSCCRLLLPSSEPSHGERKKKKERQAASGRGKYIKQIDFIKRTIFVVTKWERTFTKRRSSSCFGAKTSARKDQWRGRFPRLSAGLVQHRHSASKCGHRRRLIIVRRRLLLDWSTSEEHRSFDFSRLDSMFLFEFKIERHGHLIRSVLSHSDLIGRALLVGTLESRWLIEVTMEALMETECFQESREKGVELLIVGNARDSRHCGNQMLKREIGWRGEVESLVEKIELFDLSDGGAIDEWQTGFV